MRSAQKPKFCWKAMEDLWSLMEKGLPWKQIKKVMKERGYSQKTIINARLLLSKYYPNLIVEYVLRVLKKYYPTCYEKIKDVDAEKLRYLNELGWIIHDKCNLGKVAIQKIVGIQPHTYRKPARS